MSKVVRISDEVYEKLSKAGSLGTTYSEVIDNALIVYLKQAGRNQ